MESSSTSWCPSGAPISYVLQTGEGRRRRRLSPRRDAGSRRVVEGARRLRQADRTVQAGGIVQRLRLVDPLPREVVVVAAEVAVCSGFCEDRAAEIEIA